MEIFAISPTSSKPIWFLLIICLVLLFVVFALFMAMHAYKNSAVVVDDEEIRIKGGFWSKNIAIKNLDLENAKFIDIDKNSPYRAKWRKFGTSLPGYAAGWFKLHNGEKAYMRLTKSNKVVYIPTHEGYSILVSVDKPTKFLDKLKSY